MDLNALIKNNCFFKFCQCTEIPDFCENFQFGILWPENRDVRI